MGEYIKLVQTLLNRPPAQLIIEAFLGGVTVKDFASWRANHIGMAASVRLERVIRECVKWESRRE